MEDSVGYKGFWENDCGVDKLMAQVIKSALRDYTCDVDETVKNTKKRFWEKNGSRKLTKKQKKHLLDLKTRLTKDKSIAIYFFEKSRLFKLTEINFEWLLSKKDIILEGDDE